MIPQMTGQVPLGYPPMMMNMNVQQPGYPMPMPGMPGMMIPQVRPPMGIYPQPMFPGQVPNP